MVNVYPIGFPTVEPWPVTPINYTITYSSQLDQLRLEVLEQENKMLREEVNKLKKQVNTLFSKCARLKK